MTTRQERVNSVLQREISVYIKSEGFEGITGLVTITNVEVTANLKHAKVFFSVVGQDGKDVLHILRKHLYEIQGMLNSKLEMKNIPRVVFVHEASATYAQHIGKLINDLHDDQNQR